MSKPKGLTNWPTRTVTVGRVVLDEGVVDDLERTAVWRRVVLDLEPDADLRRQSAGPSGLHAGQSKLVGASSPSCRPAAAPGSATGRRARGRRPARGRARRSQVGAHNLLTIGGVHRPRARLTAPPPRPRGWRRLQRPQLGRERGDRLLQRLRLRLGGAELPSRSATRVACPGRTPAGSAAKHHAVRGASTNVRESRTMDAPSRVDAAAQVTDLDSPP